MTFAKGQPVTYISNWDRKGTVCIRELVVYSCGKKQMILTDEAGAKFQGANFSPQQEQYSYGYVMPRMSREDAEAFALELGARIVKEERERMERQIAHYAYPESHGYTISMRKSIAELHEPRIEWRGVGFSQL